MNRFEKKAQWIIRHCWAYDDLKKMDIIAKELEQEYKNAKKQKAVEKK